MLLIKETNSFNIKYKCKNIFNKSDTWKRECLETEIAKIEKVYRIR